MLFVVLHHHSVNIVRTLCHKNLKCCLKGFTWLFGCYPAFEQHKTNTTFYWIIKVSKTWTRRFYSPTWNSVCHNFATTSHSWSILRKNFVFFIYIFTQDNTFGKGLLVIVNVLDILVTLSTIRGFFSKRPMSLLLSVSHMFVLPLVTLGFWQFGSINFQTFVKLKFYVFQCDDMLVCKWFDP